MIFSEPLRLKQKPRGLGLGSKYREPALIVGFDTETVGGYAYTTQFSDSRGRRELIDCHSESRVIRAGLASFLEEGKPGDFILAGAFYFRFDIQVIFRDMPTIFEGLGAIDFEDENGVHWKGASQWPVIFLIGRYKKRTLLLIDCWRFFQGSLESVCEDLKLPFKKMERPPCIPENREPTEAERPYFNEYAMTDADATLEILKRIDGIWRTEDVGPCISVAHMAGRIFRRNYTDNQGLDIADEHGQMLGLLAYKGGRNSLAVPDGYELPLVMDGCAMYDVRSLYPFICSEMLPGFFGGRWVWTLENPKLQSAAIYNVKGTLVQGDCWPYRFLMDAQGDYLTPGPIDCSMTGFELITAMKHGLLTGPLDVQGIVWEPGESIGHPFREFYGEVFKQKEAQRGKNPVLYSYYKNLANCLTGKFVSTIPLEQETLQTVLVDGAFTDQRLIEKIRVPGLLWNPPVGALITGAGRAVLFEAELAHGSIHGATDSLVVPPGGVRPLEGKGLGQWEKVCEGRFVAARNKLYCFLGPKDGNYTGVKGTGRKKLQYWHGQEILKYALHAFKGNIFQFLDAVFDGKREYHYSRMVQVKESRKRKNLKPLQMNDFVETLKLGGKYYQK